MKVIPKPNVSKMLSGRRILIPILLGVGVAVFFIWRDFDYRAIARIQWRSSALFWFLAAVTMVVLRDLGYMVRLRILSSRQLNWRQCFEIAVLWEFSSAVSPGAIGGTAVAFVIMAQEKMKTGLTTAIVIITAFLDELFYILMVPIMFIWIGSGTLIPEISTENFISWFSSGGLAGFFWFAYAILALWTLFLFIAIFHRPTIIKTMILWIFRLPFLQSRRYLAMRLGRDLVTASREFSKMGAGFWMKAFGATCLSWTARFMVLNCLLMAFAGFEDHLLAYARQLVMWVILLLPVTPGASGIAESIFPIFMGDFVPDSNLSGLLAVVWRMLSYYPYIIIGAIILPLWLKRVSSAKR